MVVQYIFYKIYIPKRLVNMTCLFRLDIHHILSIPEKKTGNLLKKKLLNKSSTLQ
jgi:hypothetical protein